MVPPLAVIVHPSPDDASIWKLGFAGHAAPLYFTATSMLFPPLHAVPELEQLDGLETHEALLEIAADVIWHVLSICTFFVWSASRFSALSCDWNLM